MKVDILATILQMKEMRNQRVCVTCVRSHSYVGEVVCLTSEPVFFPYSHHYLVTAFTAKRECYWV